MRSCGRFIHMVALLATTAVIGCAAGTVDPTGGSGNNSAAVTDTAGLAGNPDPSGFGATLSTNGSIDTSNPFFQSLGTNGRSCGSCHVQAVGWTITPANVQARFAATGGTDPIFRTNDGSNSPNADVSTVQARQAAYNMLLTKGLIRVGIGIPANAEFSLSAVDDPYNYASAAELSLFRRPLPSTNLGFLSTVMWDGRETFAGQSIAFDLGDQANGATLGHAQATMGLTSTQDQLIVSFESALFTAQTIDTGAGNLASAGALGGPQTLENQTFYIGINDPLGNNPTGAAFNPVAFTIYDAWAPPTQDSTTSAARRYSINRGQAIFNSRTFNITGVGGLNDKLGVASISGTCTLCHDTPNVGDHSVPAPLNIGIADASRRTADMPLYTLQNNATGATVQTTDPGRALISGKWADIGKFKGPILRGLAMRAPYFHNGSASSLSDVVGFYNARFGIGLSTQDQADLVAFLQAL